MTVEKEKLLGLTKQRAIDELKKNGNEYTILQEDGNVYGKADFIGSRFNLVIMNGRVTKIIMG